MYHIPNQMSGKYLKYKYHRCKNANCSASQPFYIFNQPIMEHTEAVKMWRKYTMWIIELWKAIEIWPLGKKVKTCKCQME